MPKVPRRGRRFAARGPAASRPNVGLTRDGAELQATASDRRPSNDGFPPSAAPDHGDPAEEVTVGPDEAIRFAPGEFQVGHNEGEERVAAFAFGAPDARHDFDAIEAATFCPECGEETGHSLALEDGSFGFTCEACGLERSL